MNFVYLEMYEDDVCAMQIIAESIKCIAELHRLLQKERKKVKRLQKELQRERYVLYENRDTKYIPISVLNFLLSIGCRRKQYPKYAPPLEELFESSPMEQLFGLLGCR